MSDLDLLWSDLECLEYLLTAGGTPLSLAKMHGIMTGMICAGETKPKDCWEKLQREMPFLGLGETLIYESFSKLFNLTLDPLQRLESNVLLALPTDEDPLSLRLEALADWCQGFSMGMEFAGLPVGSLSQMPIVTEILEDLSAIEEVSLQEGDSEMNEKSYVEIVEFLRISIMLIHTECEDAKRSQRLEHQVH